MQQGKNFPTIIDYLESFLTDVETINPEQPVSSANLKFIHYIKRLTAGDFVL